MKQDIGITLVLYLIWVGLPLAFVVFGVFVRALSGDHPPPWLRTVGRWGTVFVFSAAASIAVDRFVIPNEELRKEIYKHIGNPQIVRVLVFPVAVFVFYVLATFLSFFREPEGNFRFRREVGGNFSWGLLLGFGLMILACIYGKAPSDEYTHSTKATKVEAAPPQAQKAPRSVLNIPEVSTQARAAIDPLVREFGELQRGILTSLGNFRNDEERKQSEDALVNQGLNLPNYRQYRDMIVDIAKRQEVEPELALAVVAVESRFNPDFRANDGGQGLMNVTANMARQLGIPDFLNPTANVEVGCGVLKAQLNFFGADKLEQALAAYHFGTEKVRKDPDIVKTDETVRRYVSSVLAVRDGIKSNE